MEIVDGVSGMNYEFMKEDNKDYFVKFVDDSKTSLVGKLRLEAIILAKLNSEKKRFVKRIGYFPFAKFYKITNDEIPINNNVFRKIKQIEKYENQELTLRQIMNIDDMNNDEIINKITTINEKKLSEIKNIVNETKDHNLENKKYRVAEIERMEKQKKVGKK